MKKESGEHKRQVRARLSQERRNRDKLVLIEIGVNSAEGLVGKIHRMTKAQRAALRKIIESV